MPPRISIFSSVVILPRIDSTRLSTPPFDCVDWAKPNCVTRTKAMTAVSLFVMIQAIRLQDGSPQDLSSAICIRRQSPAVLGHYPCARVRTQRFGELSLRSAGQTQEAERVEVGIGERVMKCGALSESPRAMGTSALASVPGGSQRRPCAPHHLTSIRL